MEKDAQLICPGLARKNVIEGSAIVEVQYDRNDSVLSSQVAESSSYEVLDEAKTNAAVRSWLSKIALEKADFRHPLKITFKLEHA